MKFDLTIKVKDCEIEVEGSYDEEEGLTIDKTQGDVLYALVCGVTIGDIEDKILARL